MMKLISFFLFFLFLLNTNIPSSNAIKQANEETDSDVFQVKVIDLGAVGDCTLITYGDVQILIDCGGVSSSFSKIYDVLCTSFPENDTVLDYVIISHGDSDHIASFACKKYETELGSSIVFDEKSCLTCFLRKNNISIGTFIDFDPNMDESFKDEDSKLTGEMKLNIETKHDTDLDDDEDENDDNNKSEDLTKVYKRYSNARECLLKPTNSAHIENYFTASQCLYEKRGGSAEDVDVRKDNKIEASDSFTFGNGKGKIKILDNKYCYTKVNDNANTTSLDKNLLAVCCLIEFDGYKYLFTGDLPEFDSTNDYRRIGGETSLLEANYNDLKDGVLFFKAGHHGSQTSNSDNLLNVIKPQYIAIPCVAGSVKYNFPKDTVLQTMTLYTDKIYITSYKMYNDDNEEGTVTPYHGTITFEYKPDNAIDEKLSVSYTGTVGKDSLMDDSSVLWTLIDDKKRTVKSKKATSVTRAFTIRVMELSSWEGGIRPNDCTYVKAGHYDILINDGEDNTIATGETKGNDYLSIEDKIDSLCNDHVLDCLVISSLMPISYSRLIGSNGLLTKYINDEHISKIKNVIINPMLALTVDNNNDSNNTSLKNLQTLKSTLINLRNNKRIDSIIGITNNSFDSSISSQRIFMSENGDNYVQILNGKYNSEQANDWRLNSLGIDVHFGLCGSTFDYLNFGNLNDKDEMLEIEETITAIDAMTIPAFGCFNKDTGTFEEREKYWKAKASDCFSALFNGPFGLLNSDNKNVYPVEAFRYSYLMGQNLDYSSAFRTNKIIDTSHTNNLSSASIIDLCATFSYPQKTSKAEVQYRQFYMDSSSKFNYFSVFNLDERNFSKYWKTQVSSQKDECRNTLTKEG